MKKLSRSIFLGIFVCILFASNSVKAVDQAYFTADKTTPLIGEPIRLVLHIHVPQQAKLILPDFAGIGSPFSVKEVGSLSVVHQVENGVIEYELPLVVILWQTGQYVTSPLVVSYQLDGSAPVNMTIEGLQFVAPSVLDANDLSLRPLKSQINLLYFPARTFVIGFIIFVASCIFVICYRLIRIRYLKAHTDASDKYHPQATAALMRLRQLEQSQDSSPMIYIRVADCLRSYLDVRFAVQATDLTTSELAVKLEEQQVIVRENRQKLIELLRRADLVKFARVTPNLSAAQQYSSFAAEWIEAVEQTYDERLP